MNTCIRMTIGVCVALLIGASASALDADAIGKIIRTKATTSPDGVVKVTWGRSEVPVKVDGYPLQPFAGITSWAAFEESEAGARVMGDTVVFQDEVNPAMDAAFANGIDVTGLHNHFFYDEPKVFFMHIGGTGDPAALANGVKAIWDAIREVRAQNRMPVSTFPGRSPKSGKISAQALSEILGAEAKTSDGMAKFSWGREGMMHGDAVGGSMGLTTWAAFSGNDDLAVMDGDFIMSADEVQRVLRAMRRADINVVALHNHMIGEEPAYYFTHFWAKGAPVDLARAFRSVMVAQGK